MRQLQLLLELPPASPSVVVVVVGFSHASFMPQSKSESFSQSVHAQALSLSHPLLLGLSEVAVAVASCH